MKKLSNDDEFLLVAHLADYREHLRHSKNFESADKIRKLIEKQGWEVRDMNDRFCLLKDGVVQITM